MAKKNAKSEKKKSGPKVSASFKSTIENHLIKTAEQDPLFAESYKKENKNIDECLNYILGEVKNSGLQGFEDDEIFNMAIHYYDEDDLKVKAVRAGHVVVNHHVELTEEEKQEAHDKAVQKVIDEKAEKLKAKAKKKSEKKVEPADQGTLF